MDILQHHKEHLLTQPRQQNQQEIQEWQLAVGACVHSVLAEQTGLLAHCQWQ
jgi:hypothetical protein